MNNQALKSACMLNANYAQLVRDTILKMRGKPAQEIRNSLRSLLVENGGAKVVVRNPDCIFNSKTKIDSDLMPVSKSDNLFNRMTSGWQKGNVIENAGTSEGVSKAWETRHNISMPVNTDEKKVYMVDGERGEKNTFESMPDSVKPYLKMHSRGYLSIQKNRNGEWTVADVQTAKEHQRKGIASSLYDKAEKDVGKLKSIWFSKSGHAFGEKRYGQKVSNRKTYPNGNLIPVEGDTVVQNVPNLDGVNTSIEGQVRLVNDRLRVFVIGEKLSNSGKSYPLNTHWNVKTEIVQNTVKA